MISPLLVAMLIEPLFAYKFRLKFTSSATFILMSPPTLTSFCGPLIPIRLALSPPPELVIVKSPALLSSPLNVMSPVPVLNNAFEAFRSALTLIERPASKSILPSRLIELSILMSRLALKSKFTFRLAAYRPE